MEKLPNRISLEVAAVAVSKRTNMPLRGPAPGVVHEREHEHEPVLLLLAVAVIAALADGLSLRVPA